MRQCLADLRDLDVYRYLVMSMVASGAESLHGDLLAAAHQLRDRRKQEIMLEAAELLAHQRAFAELAKTLRRQIGDKHRL